MVANSSIFGLIYCITNIADGKQYVGQTSGSLECRWRVHRYYARTGSPGFLHRAIGKYGEKSFICQKIADTLSQEDADRKEIFFITELGTLAPSGYNLTLGGEGCRHSEETRRKISTAGLNRVCSEETRQKLSSSHTKTLCKRSHSLSGKNVYVDSRGGRHCLACRYLYQYGRIPESLLECAERIEVKNAG